MTFSANALRTGIITVTGAACLLLASSPAAIARQGSLAVDADNTLITEVNSGTQVAAGARNFVSNMGDRAIGFLSDPALTHEQRKVEFRKLLEDSFDMETIGRFALGSSWKMATPQQRTEYQKLFKQMIVNVYSRRFEEYQGQKFEARTSRPEGDKDIIVTSYIIPQRDPEVRVDWRIRYKDGRYRVVDVIVEGVSMAITQRSDFASVIQRGGGNFQVLLDHMRKQVQQPS